MFYTISKENNGYAVSIGKGALLILDVFDTYQKAVETAKHLASFRNATVLYQTALFEYHEV